MSDKIKSAVERKIQILRMIPRSSGKIGITDIEKNLRDQDIEIGRRTVQRDLVDLSGWFPIICDDRKPYGWSWMPGADGMDIPRMSPVSALTFKMTHQYLSQLMPPSSFTSLSPYFSHASKVLSDEKQVKLQSWSDKIRIINRSQPLIYPDIDAPIIETVYESLLEGKRFSAVYRRRGENDTVEYIVNPLGIVLVDSLIYLVCTLRDYNQLKDVKQIALHRIVSAEKLESQGIVPEGFSLQAYVDSDAFGYPKSEQDIRLKAAFDRKVAQHLYETPLSKDQVISGIDTDSERVMVEASVADTARLRWWLLGFGDSVEVIEPVSLREELSENIKKMHERYFKRH